MTAFRRVIWIVLDSVGIGEMPDAARLRRRGQRHARQHRAHSGRCVCRICARSASPTSSRLTGSSPLDSPRPRTADAPGSPGKDTTTGHWEMVGIHLDKPFPAVSRSASRTRSFTSSRADRTQDARELPGIRHRDHPAARRRALRTGSPIVYTSADSVFQIAAHEDVIPLEELYRICEIARELLRGEHEVGRVIARPFVGTSGALHAHREPPRLRRSAAARHAARPAGTIAACPVHSVGKISDVFLGRGITRSGQDEVQRGRHGEDARGHDITRGRPHLRQPRRLRSELRPSQRCRRLREALEEVDAWLPNLLNARATRRPHHPHCRPWLRPDHSEHRSQPRVCSAARLRWQTGRRSWHAFDTL